MAISSFLRYRVRVNWFAILVVSLICSTASCKKNHEKSSININNPTPIPNSAHLFNLGISDSELANRKNAFLNSKEIIEINPPRKLINISPAKLNRYKVSPTPRIASYGGPDSGQDIYCLEIPKEFRNNIPEKIKQEIIARDIKDLDIYIFAQTKRFPSLDVLRVHNWAYPHIPVPFTGSLFNRDLLMTAFPISSGISLSNQIIEGKLLPFNVNLHDGLISPDNAHMGLASAPDKNFAFYTLVIDPVSKRAIVTFHWLIKAEDFSDDPLSNPNYLHSLRYLNHTSLSLPTSLNVLVSSIKALPNFSSPTDEALNELERLLK